MRLAIIAHDTGKAKAVAAGQKERQNVYNAVQAWDFFSQAGVDEKMAHLLVGIISEGEELAFQMDVRHAPGAKQAMSTFAVEAARKFYGSGRATKDHARGIVSMCKMLRVCDGGAYTSMAVTRSTQGNYRNRPAFNESFIHPRDLGRRMLRPRTEVSQKAAANNLTPKVP